MKETKHIKSSETTTYQIKLERIKEKLYTVTVKYVIDGKIMGTPLLYYRIKSLDHADTYFKQITDIIETNKNSLCINNMKNWIFNIHIIRYLLKSRN